MQIILATTGYYIVKINGKIQRGPNGGAATFKTAEEALAYFK